MPRHQFSLKTMLWLMALVGALLCGMLWERRLTTERVSELEALCAQREKQVIQLEKMYAKARIEVAEMAAENER